MIRFQGVSRRDPRRARSFPATLGCVRALAACAGFALVLGVSLADVARAVDGVVEINQTSALAGGITPGDAPGFPVTLSERGAYRLTGNLTLPDQNAIGIDVTIDSVNIDLGGFAILGPVVCTGNPVSACLPAGGGTGIGIRGPNNVSVHDGTIRGTGAAAINLTWNARVEKVDVTFVAPPPLSGAIVVGNQSLVSETAVTSVGRIGISASNFSIVKDSTSTGNSDYGIVGGAGTLVRGCTVSQNAIGLGFFGSVPGAYAGNSITSNTGNTINGTAVNLGGNLCNNALCP